MDIAFILRGEDNRTLPNFGESDLKDRYFSNWTID